MSVFETGRENKSLILPSMRSQLGTVSPPQKMKPLGAPSDGPKLSLNTLGVSHASTNSIAMPKPPSHFQSPKRIMRADPPHLGSHHDDG